MSKLTVSVARWTVVIYGAIAFVLGLLGIISPTLQLNAMGLENTLSRATGDYTMVMLGSSNFAAVNMGVLYILGAIRRWSWFCEFTVWLRAWMCFGFILMICMGTATTTFLGAAVWEGLGALITLLAILWDRSRSHVRKL